MQDSDTRSAKPTTPSIDDDGASLVVVSVDVEEDNWTATREGVTVENVRELPRLHSFLRGLGVRPTYFTTYQVAATPWAAGIIRELHDSGEAEIGAHLHPWNTPPLREPLTPHNTMTSNLVVDLQREKLEALTDQIRTVLGVRPTAFRAGRFGFGPRLVPSLVDLGFEADSSVTPFVDWTEYDGGPNYIGAPLHRYRIAADREPRKPAPHGPLVELPVTSGFTRLPFGFWSRVHRGLDAPWLRSLHAWGAVSRLTHVRKVVLSPESEAADDMVELSRRLMERRVGYLHLFFHSSSLRAGLSPFARTEAGVDRLYATIQAYVEALERMTSVRFVTASEAAARPRGHGAGHVPARTNLASNHPAAASDHE